MANFHIFTGNHGPHSQETLRDIIDPIRYTLNALGHTVVNGHPAQIYDHGTYNIIVEYFTPSFMEVLENMPKTVWWGLILTEWFDGQGFNKQDSHEWKERFWWCKKMVEVPTCKFAWSLTPETAEWAKGLGKKAAYLELGYVPEMLVAINSLPTYDFGFVGTITPERERLLNEISQYGSLLVCNGTKAERDIRLAMCRWSLGFKPDLPLPYPSATRGPASLYAGTPVLWEPVERPTRVAVNCGMTMIYRSGYDPEELRTVWTRRASQAKQSNRHQEYISQMEGFRALPMKPMLEQVLDETLIP